MMRTSRLKQRQRGFILNAEFMLFTAILVMGLIVGWVVIRDSLNAELVDTANAIEGTITFYYFNDPDRGLGAAPTLQTLEFCEDGEGEGLIGADGTVCTDTGSVTPEGATSPTGSVTPAE